MKWEQRDQEEEWSLNEATACLPKAVQLNKAKHGGKKEKRFL